MKKLQIATLLTVMIVFYAAPASAQFLKNILNTVKQTAQNKANNKADQATDKAIDKAIAPGQGKSGNDSLLGSIDTSGMNRVLGAFAKAAKDNPNDTSSADLTMKALGNLTGGGGVSAADSAAAIKSFMSAKGGSGVMYEYITTLVSKQRGTTKDTSDIYFTMGGEGRSEMNLAGLMGLKGSDNMITLAHIDKRQYSLTMYPSEKAYGLNVIDTSLMNMVHQTYQVTKVGSETVMGYSCTHAKIITTTGSGMFKSSSTTDIWVSTGLPGYSFLKKMMVSQRISPGMMKALSDAGCEGSFVKMVMQDKDVSMNMVLTKADQKSFPASMFEVPAGYKLTNENMMTHMMGTAMKQKK